MSEPASPSPLLRPGVLLRAAAQLGLGIGLFAALVWWVSPSWEEIEGRIDIHVGWLLFGLTGSAMATVVGAARWKLLSETMGATELPYGVYFHYMAMTRLVSQVLPNLLVDLVGRGTALKHAGSDSKLGQLIAPVVPERLLDLLLPLTLFGWAVAIHIAKLPWDPWWSLAAVSVLFAALSVPLLRPAVRIALRLYGELRRLRKRDRSLPLPPMPQVGIGMSARIVLYSIVRYIGLLIQYWGSGAGFGVWLSALVLVSAVPLAQLAGLVGLTPGGLGVVEGGWVASLRQLGQDEATIVVYIAAARLMMSVNFGILTLCSWPWRRVRAQPNADSRLDASSPDAGE
ncbi:MAG: flippase-like domain-containing protein [Deltaproteobacteria bacterium]|nr:flippase-like domain-containing protein [Deltaproteobacteria bacterium]